MNALRIFLADDHAVVREGVKSLINAQAGMVVVGEAEDGETAVQKILECHPDVVVMDVSLPRLSGARATAAIREGCPRSKILAFTMHEDRSYLLEVMGAGASGYVLKRAAAADLTRAIRTVADGGTYLDSEMARKVVDRALQTPGTGALEAELSNREVEVLRLIAQGYSNKEVAAKLRLSVKTVETYKTRGMEKVGLDSRVDLVRYARDRNWLHQ